MTGHVRRPPRLLGGRHGRLAASASKSCHVHSCDVLACGRTCGRVATGGHCCMHATVSPVSARARREWRACMRGLHQCRACAHVHACMGAVVTRLRDGRMRSLACMQGVDPRQLHGLTWPIHGPKCSQGPCHGRRPRRHRIHMLRSASI